MNFTSAVFWRRLVISACCLFCTQCSTHKQAGTALTGETQYFGQHSKHAVVARKDDGPRTRDELLTTERSETSSVAGPEASTPEPGRDEAAVSHAKAVLNPTPLPIQNSITTRKRVLYETPEQGGTLVVRFDAGEVELSLESLLRFVRTDNVLTDRLKGAILDERDVTASFVARLRDEGCVISAIKVESPGFSGAKEGLYYTVWDYLDQGGNLVACRVGGSKKPKVDIARFKRTYPADPGLYDDGQALLVDGKVVLARIIAHACRDANTTTGN
jgi:hypothetical protein